MEPGRVAIGTWSGGRYLGFGERVDEDRLERLLTPGDGNRHDHHRRHLRPGRGRLAARPRARRRRPRRLQPDRRRRPRLLRGRAGRPAWLPALHRRAAPRARRVRRPTCGWPPSAASSASAPIASTCSCCTTRTASATRRRTSGTGWPRCGTTGSPPRSAVAPGPANGFTLDLLDCFERFGDRIDWAMVILNPLEPWPGELVLDAAAAAGIDVITRVVDYGGLFWDDLSRGHTTSPSTTTAASGPRAGSSAGASGSTRVRPIAERSGADARCSSPVAGTSPIRPFAAWRRP